MGKTRRVRKGGAFGFGPSKLTSARPPLPPGQTISVNELEQSVRFFETQAEMENTKGKAALLNYVAKIKKYIKDMKLKETGEFTQTNPLRNKKGGRTKKQRRRRYA
jgi:hypothetical protein